MTAYSVLDLAPIAEGQTVRDALQNTIALAQHADRLGYTRYWLAEHHNMPGIASAATSVVMGQVLAATQRIRVGSGGVMLPNHAPLVIAEQFGTLATLYPDRVDLGLGRAPGTDGLTMRALRRRRRPPRQNARDQHQSLCARLLRMRSVRRGQLRILGAGSHHDRNPGLGQSSHAFLPLLVRQQGHHPQPCGLSGLLIIAVEQCLHTILLSLRKSQP